MMTYCMKIYSIRYSNIRNFQRPKPTQIHNPFLGKFTPINIALAKSSESAQIRNIEYFNNAKFSQIPRFAQTHANFNRLSTGSTSARPKARTSPNIVFEIRTNR